MRPSRLGCRSRPKRFVDRWSCARRYSRKRSPRSPTFESSPSAHRFTLESSTDDSDEIVDSRFSVNKRKASFSTIELPPAISAFVSAYLDSLGLRYGAFDFAVTARREWVFLECNEGGQFLYLEKILPALNLLDAFCRWLAELAGRSTTGADAVLKLADFDRSGDPLRRASWSTHKQQLGNRAFIEEDG
jgi:hypothetical protein